MFVIRERLYAHPVISWFKRYNATRTVGGG